MASESRVNSFKEVLVNITRHEAAKLVSRPAWGEVNFKPIEGVIKSTIGIARQYEALPLHLLTDEILGAIQDHLSALAMTLDGINKFRVDAHNHQHTRDNYMRDMTERGTAALNDAAKWCTFLSFQASVLKEETPTYSNMIESTNSTLTKATEDARKLLAEIADIMQAARDAAALQAAAVFAQQFKKEADANGRHAKWWLGATAVLAAVTAVMACYFWAHPEVNLPEGVLIQKLSTKFVVMGLLVTAVVWCGKNYKALTHLAVVNRHRVSCISTLEAFNAAAKSDEAKQMVLMEVTKSAFGHLPTGFVGDGNAESDMKIVEVARSIVDRNKTQ